MSIPPPKINEIVNTALFDSSTGIDGDMVTYDVDDIVMSGGDIGYYEARDTFTAVGKDSNRFYLLKTDKSTYSTSDTAYKYYQYDDYTWDATESYPGYHRNHDFEHEFTTYNKVLLDTSKIPSGYSGIIYSIFPSEINPVPGVDYA